MGSGYALRQLVEPRQCKLDLGHHKSMLLDATGIHLVQAQDFYQSLVLYVTAGQANTLRCTRE